jgi:hypothetical protein
MPGKGEGMPDLPSFASAPIIAEKTYPLEPSITCKPVLRERLSQLKDGNM